MAGIVRLMEKVVQWLRQNKKMVSYLVIPVSIFMLDLILRAMLHLDLVDVGTDLAFLSFTAFVSSLTEDTRSEDTEPKVALLLFFFLMWLICLALISSAVPIVVQIRPFIAIGVGLMSFILASILLALLARS